MNQEILLDKLRTAPFEPFVIITNSGDRYEVHNPELLRVAPRHVYVFQWAGPKGLVKDPAIVGLRNISALEPLPREAA